MLMLLWRLLLLMSSVANPAESRQYRKYSIPWALVGTLRTAGFGIGAIALILLAIPAVVVISAAILLFIAWPIFFGSWFEYGFVPGERIQNPPDLSTQWYWLQLVWLAVIVGTPVLVVRTRARLRQLSMPTIARRRPRLRRRRRPA